MSLINDALRRAREAQEQHQSKPRVQPELCFKPIDSVQHASVRLPRVPVGALLVVAVLGALLAWRLSISGTSSPVDIAARAPSQAAPAQVPAPETPQRKNAPVPQPVQPRAASTPAPARSTLPVPAAAPAANRSLPEKKPQVLQRFPKLQAIIYNPKRPSAIMDGRTLFVGDYFDDFRVVKIAQDSAILTSQGTNYLFRLAR